MQVLWQVLVSLTQYTKQGFFFFFLRKQVDRIEKRKLVLVFQEKLAVTINMQLIEGQVCVFFLNKKKTDR